MSDDAAYIRISLSDGTFEIKGSEDFVSSQADRFEDMMKELLTRSPRAPSRKQESEERETASDKRSTAPETAYPRVFSQKGDGYAITAKIPGSSTAEKMANIGLLLALAYKMDGQDGVEASIVRQACEDHGCYDSKNFKTTFKKRKEHFVIEGGSQQYDIKLTVPGRDEAEELAEAIQTA